MPRRVAIGVFAFLLAAPAPGLAQSAQELFQQALVNERSHAMIDEAAALYRLIVNEHGDDRPVAAQALLRLGGILEMQGSPDAGATYERLLRDFADQAAPVAQARARLAALAPATSTPLPPAPVRRLIADVDSGLEARTTRDGEHRLRYNEERRAFELIEIGSTQVRLLTSDGPDPDDEDVTYSALSADGLEIAAVVFAPSDRVGDQRRLELRLFAVGGSGDGRSIFAWEGAQYSSIRPLDWSAGEARIWLWALKADRAAEIASVDLETGTFEVLKTLAWRSLTQPPSRSPDGRFITYHDADSRDGPSDVFVLATDGSRELRLDHAADDTRPLFAPDGSGVVFVSNRRDGIRDLWFQPLADGRADGEPRLVWRDVGPFGTARRFADNGSLVYYFASTRWEVFTARLDSGSGLATQVEHVAPPATETNEAPAYSPDGRHLALMRDRGRRLVLRDVASGTEREYPLGASLMAPRIDWCPSANVAFVTGYQAEPVALRVDLDRGGAEPLPLAGPARALCLGHGDEVIYVQSSAIVGGPARIVRRVLASGEETTLFQGHVLNPYSLNRSHDGRQIVFRSHNDDDEAYVMVMPSAGGQARSVATAPLLRGFGRAWSELHAALWLPGGDDLLVVRGSGVPSPEETAPDVFFSRLSLDTGQETGLGRLQLPAFEGGFYGNLGYSLSPDASSIAFSRHAGTTAEVWAIDHLLAFIQSGQTAPPTPIRR